MTAIRVNSDRPALIVVGPRAAALLQPGHSDLELVDVLEVHGVPSAAEADWLRDAGVFDRPFAVVLFDPRDEHLWSAVRSVVDAARSQTSAPLWLVSAGRPGRRIAEHLAVCVVDAGGANPLDVAMLPVAGLFRCGLTGFDVGDLTSMASPGDVARASQGTEVVADATVDRALVVMRCSNDTTLGAINSAALEIAARLENAELLFATPTYESDVLSLETFVLSFHSRVPQK